MKALKLPDSKETPLLADQGTVLNIIHRRITALLVPVRFPQSLCEGQDYPHWIKHIEHDGQRGFVFWSDNGTGLQKRTRELYPDGGGFESPYGYGGDYIYVKEGFGFEEGSNHKVTYRADCESPEKKTWAPANEMRKVQARLWLRVGTVKCLRLSDITDVWTFNCAGYATSGLRVNQMYKQWNVLHAHKSNGIYAWDRNPWVWQIHFMLDRNRSKNV